MLKTALTGLKISIKHFFLSAFRSGKRKESKENYLHLREGAVTLQYPTENRSIPPRGRYQLYVNMDDCVVCNLCAKVCPVDCIEIESIKSVEDLGKTSGGTTKRLHAAKFYIDNAKCMFCGLCTKVCPTDCIFMTSDYDVSSYGLEKLNIKFAHMSKEEIEAKRTALQNSLINKNKGAAKTEIQ